MSTAKQEFIDSHLCEELAEKMEQKYSIAMKERSFSISAKVEDDFVYVSITLQNQDQTFYYPVETRMNFSIQELTPGRAAIFLIDYIDTYFEEFLLEEDEELFLPIDWKEHHYDACDFQIKGQIINLKAERIADSLLEDSLNH